MNEAELESRVIEAVAELLDVPEAEREELLRRQWGTGPFADRVRAVLPGAGSLDGFLERSPVVVEAVTDDRRGLAEGTRVGRYTIRSLIGSGGMGDVYRAETAGSDGCVALKIVRPGVVTRRLRRRFEFEVSALARLRHDGIARLLDSGVHNGEDGERPFLVMELVTGPNLLDHAAARSLDVPDRLRLILKVCDAVGHAHRGGVIHRDLKPDNILVDSATGDPKVLDFGVARAIDPEGSQASGTADQLVGSVPYMSPEQAGGSPGKAVDTRTDVYALGAVLYELLAGRPAYRPSAASLLEFVRMVREGDPPRLGTVVPALRGELEAVVHAAMARDLERRYQSVEAFADDLRRYLSGDPLSIRRASALYLIGKVASRHRTVVSFACGAAVLLVFAMIFGWVQMARAQRAEQRSDLLLRQVVEASQSVVVDLNKALRDSGQPLEARRIALRTATDYLERVRSEVKEDPRILTALMRSYVRLGEVIGGAGDASLGMGQEAKEMFAEAAAIGSGLLSRSESAEVRRLMASVVEGQAMLEPGNEPAARFRQAADHLAAAGRMSAGTVDGLLDARRELQLRARAAAIDGSADEVEQVIRSLEQLARRHPDDAALWSERGIAERMLGELLVEREPARAFIALEASLDSFGRSISLGQDDFTNNRHSAQAQALTVRCLAGARPADVLLATLKGALDRSELATELAGPSTIARNSHMVTLLSVLSRGVELVKAPDPAGRLAPGEIASRVLHMTRADLTGLRSRAPDEPGFPAEQWLTTEIELRVAELRRAAAGD